MSSRVMLATSTTRLQPMPYSNLTQLSPSQLAQLQKITASAPILVSDDDSMTRKLYRAILAPFELPFLDTWNPAEALTICQQQPISLIISDIRNQNLNGLELVRLLRADPTTRHIPL